MANGKLGHVYQLGIQQDICAKNNCEEPNYRKNISYNLATFTSMVDFKETTFSKEKKWQWHGQWDFFQYLNVDSLTLPWKNP